MIFLKTLKQIISKDDVLPDNHHVVRCCKVDTNTGEIGLDAFELRDRDIEKGNGKPCVSGQWWEYWKKDINKIVMVLKDNNIKFNKRSRLCCVKVERIKSIGKRHDMSLDITHTGKGHVGIFNIRRNEFKFKRDMMFEARNSIIEIVDI